MKNEVEMSLFCGDDRLRGSGLKDSRIRVKITRAEAEAALEEMDRIVVYSGDRVKTLYGDIVTVISPDSGCFKGIVEDLLNGALFDSSTHHIVLSQAGYFNTLRKQDVKEVLPR